MNTIIYPKKIFNRLLYFIVFLCFANVTGIISKLYFVHDYVYGLVPLFNFDKESNIPTFYSSFALLFASFLLFFISSIHKKRTEPWLPWLWLAFIFLFLSIDEFSSIHEVIGNILHKKFNTTGLLYFAWIIPYGVFLLIFIIYI